jgi:hypothetical protein
MWIRKYGAVRPSRAVETSPGGSRDLHYALPSFLEQVRDFPAARMFLAAVLSALKLEPTSSGKLSTAGSRSVSRLGA